MVAEKVMFKNNPMPMLVIKAKGLKHIYLSKNKARAIARYMVPILRYANETEEDEENKLLWKMEGKHYKEDDDDEQ